MDRYIVFFSLAVILFVLGPGEVRGCSCARLPTPQEALEAADAVFSGKVIATWVDDTDAGAVRRVVISVERTWKGTLGRTVEIRTARSSAACGVDFQKGKRYLIYAYRWEDTLRVTMCDRTRPIELADEDLRYLNGNRVGGRGGLCGGPSNVVAVQMLFFVLVFVRMGAFLTRRKRAE